MIQNAATEIYRQTTGQHSLPITHWDTWNRARWAPSQGSGRSIQDGQSGRPCPAVSSPDWEAHRNVEHQIPAGSEIDGLPAGSWRGRLMPNTAWADRKGDSDERKSRQEEKTDIILKVNRLIIYNLCLCCCILNIYLNYLKTRLALYIRKVLIDS